MFVLLFKFYIYIYNLKFSCVCVEYMHFSLSARGDLRHQLRATPGGCWELKQQVFLTTKPSSQPQTLLIFVSYLAF